MKGIKQFFSVFLIYILMIFMGMPLIPENVTAQRIPGFTQSIGNGEVTSFAQFDEQGIPIKIGVAFSADALEGLPSTRSDLHNCADRNEDGTVDKSKECSPWHEWVLPLPHKASKNNEIPFNWILLNWNPRGHIPPGVYDTPHFDIHYYIAPIAEIFAIEAGTCGPEYVDCDQFEVGKKPVPEQYMHADFVNLNAVAPSMGNHLIDTTAVEFKGEPFTHTWIYGAYDGEVIFYEQMVTREFVLGKNTVTQDIKTTPAVERSGFYPNSYSIEHNKDTDEYLLSLENFTYREADINKK